MQNKIDATDKEFKKWLIGMLQIGEVTISFTKKDGTERDLICTLKESEIPKEKTPKNSEKAKNDNVLPVFDVEKKEWRSFRWDSVKKVHVVA